METININQLPIKVGDFVLDLGCGEGRHSIASQWHFPKAKIIALDLNIEDLKTAEKKQNEFQPLNSTIYLNASAYQLPFASESLDHIICSEVLEHLDDYQQALKEIQRCLKPGGSLSISVPRWWPERLCWLLSKSYHQVPGGHVRIFKGSDLNKNIRQLGFKQQQHYWAHALHSPYWWLRCLFWRQGEQQWLCRQYHKLLIWDLLKKPALTRQLERLLNPVMGKSIVWQFEKK
ncbi:methyltransferase domain-containing protein [Agaribacterium sp. ZY112]|uniref:class I SAM-dependent methyltransferase n=1 Tax=Agaribacterium sp. ZY112 TaxID=3233574 RepID=UPI003524AD2F